MLSKKISKCINTPCNKLQQVVYGRVMFVLFNISCFETPMCISTFIQCHTTSVLQSSYIDQMRSHISWFERFVQTRHVLRHFVFVGQFVWSTSALLITSTVTIKTCFHVMAQCFYFCSRDHGMCMMLCLLVYFKSHNHAIVVLVLLLCLFSLSDNTYMCFIAKT